VSWDEALDPRWCREIQRIQATYGDDAFAMLSGVSLTNEKSYLVGKFARLALHTANLDYNGRYCMVSAGVGNKKALGVDRAPNPWSDIPLADVVWVAGSNVAETFPITTSYIWRARDRGAKLIVRTLASCRWPAPPTCSCRSGPGATRRCSARCCTS
jgi:assimilatory nitrate reductase catalytic subunit